MHTALIVEIKITIFPRLLNDMQLYTMNDLGNLLDFFG